MAQTTRSVGHPALGSRANRMATMLAAAKTSVRPTTYFLSQTWTKGLPKTALILDAFSRVRGGIVHVLSLFSESLPRGGNLKLDVVFPGGASTEEAIYLEMNKLEIFANGKCTLN